MYTSNLIYVYNFLMLSLKYIKKYIMYLDISHACNNL